MSTSRLHPLPDRNARLSATIAAPLAVLVTALIACSGPSDNGSRDTYGNGTAGNGAPGQPAAQPGARPAAPTGDLATVIDVVDGDTFKTADGRTIRVLGIDSCETGTDAGTRATIDARALLLAGPVTLSAEPGVDLDPYRRHLRYVQASGQDYGRAMVVKDHTAVYAGRNDANPAYVTELHAADPNGRTCDDRPPPAYRPAPAPHYHDPVPDRDSSGDSPRRRTGDSGHPCLPGERDGDGDGYCGEGR